MTPQTDVLLAPEPVVSAAPRSATSMTPRGVVSADHHGGDGVRVVPDAHMANAPVLASLSFEDDAGHSSGVSHLTNAGTSARAVDDASPYPESARAHEERGPFPVDTQNCDATLLTPDLSSVGHLHADTRSMSADAPSESGRIDCDTHAEVAALPPDGQKPSPRKRRRNDGDTQEHDAAQGAGQREVTGRKQNGAPSDVASDLTLLHASLNHYARVLLDIQKVRVGMQNRAAAMERDELPEEWIAVTRAQVEVLDKAERDVTRYLRRQVEKHPMAAWVDQQRGIGLAGFARLLGIVGPLDRFATVSKLWRYLGLAVINGESQKRRKGIKLDHSPAGRVLCHQIGEAIVKVGKGGPYRAAYDERKAYYEANRPTWTPAHRHAASMRYAVKELVKQMWREWRRLQAERVLP